MLRSLIPLLVCPTCLPQERALQATVRTEADGDVISATLTCRSCRSSYPVEDGIALLLDNEKSATANGQWRYEEGGVVNSYLWSHYADLLGAAAATTAYAEWSRQLAPAGIGLDAGCAVGRITFELSTGCELAIGCDLSRAFVRTARALARKRRLDFSLPLEGELRETFIFELPTRFCPERVEFVVADALRLPFARESFGQCATLNLLDRVAYPLAHLYEINRVCRNSGASLLFSSPFSWTTASAPVERWLGGTTAGPYPGRGIDNVRVLLQGEGGILTPPWRIDAEGIVPWRHRSHANHFEEIRSLYLSASR